MLDKQKALQVMKSFLSFLDHRQVVVLKGGSAINLIYGSGRFSDDLDFDGEQGVNIENLVSQYCADGNYTYRVAKDTNQVKRYMINYGAAKPLKVEVSYRHLAEGEIIEGGFCYVYSVEEILRQKTSALANRDRARDIYDVHFLLSNYTRYISESTWHGLKQAVMEKGVDLLSHTFAGDRQNCYFPESTDGDILILEICEMLKI